jgi:putative redox protein
VTPSRRSTGDGTDFTPTDLLLASIGGCTAIDVDILTSRRAGAEAFEVRVDAEKVRDQDGNRLTDIDVTVRIVFPGGEQGDAARAVLPEAVRRSHDQLCSVGRTVELGNPHRRQDRIGPVPQPCRVPRALECKAWLRSWCCWCGPISA